MGSTVGIEGSRGPVKAERRMLMTFSVTVAERWTLKR